MMMTTDRWKEITPSQFPWELEALEYIRKALPDHEPYRAWSNFEFTAFDGSINEVDLLVVTPGGFFLVEIKSRPGHLTGDPGTWVWKQDDGKLITEDTPLFLANRKAKKLASLFKSQKSFNKIRCPFLDTLIFCSAKALTWKFSGLASSHICFRDKLDTYEKNSDGIIDALINRKANGLKQDVPRISKPESRAIGRALDQIGIRPSQKSRRVNDYKLEELIFQCPKDTYQDWEASHISLKNVKRRVRIYNVALKESQKIRSLINKAAEREFQLLNRIQHEGIVRAENYTITHLGPALIYQYAPDGLRLDLYLNQYSDKIGVDIRLALIRQIAEVIRFAHEKGVIHRGLSPQSIIVTEVDTPYPRINILNWQIGRRLSDSSTTDSYNGTITVHPDQLIEDRSLLYMSPESLNNPDIARENIDVFSLGALSYLIFSGAPPASSLMDLNQKLVDHRGLNISMVLDGSGKELCDLIQGSTSPDVLNRYETITDFLDQLQLVEEEFTEPEDDHIENPLDAKTDDKMEGGFLVKERLGKGGSATVFLVDYKGKEVVLKLANKLELNSRLKAEYDTLKKFRHHLIVEVYKKANISGLFGFTMNRAGKKTLAQRLREDGPLQLEFLQRFGSDLLQIIEHLEDSGIYHRDIKPENIGIGPTGRKGKLRLFLFDFSLAEISLENIHAGTPKYHDPFLNLRKPVRWDVSAERFAVAVTLYEMATGGLPVWGDGETAPSMLDCEVSLSSESFDSNVRKSMTAFFTKAFTRDFKKRYDNAEEMLKAWNNIFDKVDQPGTVSSHHDEPFDQKTVIKHAELDTKMIALGLSPQAQSALEYLNVITVRDLLNVPFNEFRCMRGVGIKTRNEVIKITHDLHRINPDFKADDKKWEPPPAFDPNTASIDVLAREIDKTGASASKPFLRLFLGMETSGDSLPWPGSDDCANLCSIDHLEAIEIMGTARTSWKKNPAMTRLREDISEILTKTGGVLGVADLVAAMLASRGSVKDEPIRTQMATAVCRAAVEAEKTMTNQRFIDYRRNGNIFISIDRKSVEYTDRLGKTADELADREPIASPLKAIEMLRNIDPPEKAVLIQNDHDLLKLAVYASRKAVLSARLEIYPKDMPTVRMFRLAQGSIAGARELTIEDIQSRVMGRYPQGEQIPDRPELDKILEQIGLDLQWTPAAANGLGAYCFKNSDITIDSTGSTFSSSAGDSLIPGITSDKAEARIFDKKLRVAEKNGAFLVLSVTPRNMVQALDSIKDCYELEHIDFDELFIPILKDEAKKKRIKWEVILNADSAAKDSRDWSNLQKIVGMCMPRIEEKLSKCDKTILLTSMGLLARYDQMMLLEKLRDKAGAKESRLEGMWILIPSDEQSTRPTVNGKPIPILDSSQHTRVPKMWMKEQMQHD